MRAGRTTSAGLWRFAKEYAVAADVAQKAVGQRFSHPAYFLHGRAIELALKAFLVARGTPYSKLRNRPFGHDLSALLKEARRRKLGQFAKFGAKEIAAISQLNNEYASKNLEYIVTGTFSIPDSFGVQLFTWHLVTSLERYCISSTYPELYT